MTTAIRVMSPACVDVRYRLVPRVRPGRAVLACVMTSALVGLGVVIVGDTERTRPLVGFEAHLAVLLVVWLIAGPLCDTALSRGSIS